MSKPEMADNELLALIALVNDQTAVLNMRTEAARHEKRAADYGSYHQPLVDRLKKELTRRGVL